MVKDPDISIVLFMFTTHYLKNWRVKVSDFFIRGKA